MVARWKSQSSSEAHFLLPPAFPRGFPLDPDADDPLEGTTPTRIGANEDPYDAAGAVSGWEVAVSEYGGGGPGSSG